MFRLIYTADHHSKEVFATTSYKEAVDKMNQMKDSMLILNYKVEISDSANGLSYRFIDSSKSLIKLSLKQD